MDIAAIAQGGPQQAASTLERVVGKIAKAADPAAADQIDLSSEMVAMLEARDQYETNARVIQIGDDMKKTMLNLLA